MPVNANSSMLNGLNDILIINLGGIGDILLSTPALRAIKTAYPASRLYMLVVPKCRELAEGLGYIDQAFIFDKKLSSIFKNLPVLLALRKKHFDLAINMRTLVSEISAFKINILFKAIKPKIKAGRDTEGKGHFFDISVPETIRGDKNEMEYDIDIVRKLGIEIFNKAVDFKIEEHVRVEVANMLDKAGISKNDMIIGLHPGGRPSHRWPVENFSKVIASLSKKFSCKFVITGIKEESAIVKKLISMSNNMDVVDLSSKLNIKALGALISRCDLYISNDTFPMHIAAVLKTPLIAILGPGYINRFDPKAVSDRAFVFYKNADCAPCDKTYCRPLKCLKSISPDDIIRKAIEIIGAHEAYK